MSDIRGIKVLLGCAGLLCLLAGAPRAGAEGFSDYSAKQFLAPCTEGDNDSRWGAVAESECEQYIKGFTDALLMFSGKEQGICLPEESGSRPDEIRWAFMKWAHRNFQELETMPAAEGLQATLQASFACDQ